MFCQQKKTYSLLTLVRIIPFDLLFCKSSKVLEIAVRSSRLRELTGGPFNVTVATPVFPLTSTRTKSLGAVDWFLTKPDVMHFTEFVLTFLASLKRCIGIIFANLRVKSWTLESNDYIKIIKTFNYNLDLFIHLGKTAALVIKRFYQMTTKSGLSLSDNNYYISPTTEWKWNQNIDDKFRSLIETLERFDFEILRTVKSSRKWKALQSDFLARAHRTCCERDQPKVGEERRSRGS